MGSACADSAVEPAHASETTSTQALSTSEESGEFDGAVQHDADHGFTGAGGGVSRRDPHNGGDGAPHATEHQGHESGIGRDLPLWTMLPFLGILLSIAIMPLIAQEFWHHNFSRISFFWALLFAVPFLAVYKGEAIHEILHIYLLDYIPFILLLWALFTISGGILIRGSLAGTPTVNTVMIIIGTLLASWIGTTGASMLLIRPMLRANKHRKKKVHIIVFFIFLVSNIGGSLTPLGDPPLFLGFLHGVPFFWTLNILPHMVFISILISSFLL